MTKPDLMLLAAKIHDEVLRRRRLGGYSQEAEGMLLLFETQLKIIDHLIKESSRKNTKK